MLRTHTCGELTKKNLGQTVTLCGWVNTFRNLGGMSFIDLRDRYGVTQISVVGDLQERFTDVLSQIKSEYVLQITGKVSARPSTMINKDMTTGEIEIIPDEIIILSKSEILPFEVSQENAVSEDTRLEYRYLDLRRQRMRENIQARHRIMNYTMNFFNGENFLYIETPTFVKNTPEGAREYVVPVRSHPGKFFVLPQSPQQLKQLSMVAGLDRYFQFARCYRDEDLRGDRQPEFTQLDLEMSFVQQEDVLSLLEKNFMGMSQTLYPHKKIKFSPFMRMTRDECMNKYGVDKPELRLPDWQLIELTELCKKTEFKVFQDADCIKAIVLPQSLGRSEIDKKITPALEQKGAKGNAWLSYENGERKGSIVKFFSEEQLRELIPQSPFIKGGAEGGGFSIFFQAGPRLQTCSMLGFLRQFLAREYNLLEGFDEQLAFAFVTDFPLFEVDAETGDFASAHHPFTKPKDKDIPTIIALGEKRLRGESFSTQDLKALEDMRADCYDLVLNGYELGSGSIRITDPHLQKCLFAVLGLEEKKIIERFGHILKAFSFGVPPHGGFAYGLDRVVMIYQGEPNIREIIPYPKNNQGFDPLLNAPSEIEPELLKILGLKLD